MKKKHLSLLFTSFTVVLFISMIIPEGQDMPRAEAEDFWTYISEEKPYTEWNQWPDMAGMYEGQSPHGAYLKLYLNDRAYEAVTNVKDMPDGAILVKENYNKDKKLVAITPMYRKKGYNPEAGDWFWAKYGKDGKTMASGKVQSCIDCHMKVKDDDWLFTKGK